MPDLPSKIIRVFRATVEPPLFPSPQYRQQRRAPRASLHGRVSAIIQLENGRKLPVRLHQLSVTGGLLEIANCLDERIKINLTIPFASGTVCPKAEMLFPMRSSPGYLQPFRIIRMSAEDLQLMDREITEILKNSITGKSPSSQDPRLPRFYLDTF
jgi:hypothetical protein